MDAFHLSFRTGDLERARRIYEALGCAVVRERETWLDLDFFGHQVTVHQAGDRRAAAEGIEPGGRALDHFGVNLEKERWQIVLRRLEEQGVDFRVRPTRHDVGGPEETGKFVVALPDGIGIEFKYRASLHAARGPVELRGVARGLWVWRVEHPGWKPGQGWEPVVASACVESGGETLVLDPLAPPADATDVWTRLDARPPTAAVVLKPDHVRDVDGFVRRYGARAFGPDRFLRDDIPETELEPIYPGSELPGGLIALHDGRCRNETPLWLPEQRTIVFADGLTAPGGELRVWATPWHEERVLPALREMLELPFERVIVSHGEPVHTRAAFERALGLAPWGG